jgi:hypothetical protein
MALQVIQVNSTQKSYTLPKGKYWIRCTHLTIQFPHMVIFDNLSTRPVNKAFYEFRQTQHYLSQDSWYYRDCEVDFDTSYMIYNFDEQREELDEVVWEGVIELIPMNQSS